MSYTWLRCPAQRCIACVCISILKSLLAQAESHDDKLVNLAAYVGGKLSPGSEANDASSPRGAIHKSLSCSASLSSVRSDASATQSAIEQANEDEQPVDRHHKAREAAASPRSYRAHIPGSVIYIYR